MPTIRQLESRLERQKDPKQRVILLDQLSSQYAYTNVKKAQKFLAEQNEILRYYKNPDLQLNYHINTAIVENQLYNYLLAEMHFEKAFEILEDRGGVKQQVEAYIDYSGICINRQNLVQASEYLDKAARLLTKFPDQRLQGRLTCREGILNLYYGNYGQAIELLLKAEKDLSSLPLPYAPKDYYFLTLVYSGLGNIYARNNEIEKSVNAYLKVLDMSKAMNMHTRLSWHYNNVGNSYLAMEDYDEAEKYFDKAIRITDDISQHARAQALANLGYCYFRKDRYDQALKLYSRAEQLFLEKNDIDNLFNIERWKAQLFHKLNRKKKAKYHFVRAYEYARQREDYRPLSIIFKDIAEYYADQKDYENAYLYQLEHNKAEEKYLLALNSQKIMELEVKYEAEKKKQEAELLRLQATRLQLKALRAQMNPHFMYNALNSIQNFITSNDTESAEKYLAKFSTLMRQSLEYSELEIISLEKEIEFLENYLIINQKLRFEDNLNYEIIIEDDIEEDILGVPTMIVQPYVENAIEHGLRSKKDGLIKLKFFLKDESTILCVVEDNGIGREKAKILQKNDPTFKKHRSRGTSITEKRLEILHNSKAEGLLVETIDLRDKKTGEALGTRVNIQIPIVEIQMK